MTVIDEASLVLLERLNAHPVLRARVESLLGEAIHGHEAARAVADGTAAGTFVGPIDGSMVPVVEASPGVGDKRKDKALSWQEVRLCLVHPQGGVAPVFGGHFSGGVAESGRQWARCAAKAGFGPASHPMPLS